MNMVSGWCNCLLFSSLLHTECAAIHYQRFVLCYMINFLIDMKPWGSNNIKHMRITLLQTISA